MIFCSAYPLDVSLRSILWCLCPALSPIRLSLPSDWGPRPLSQLTSHWLWPVMSMGRSWEGRGKGVRLFLPSSFALLAPGSGEVLSLSDYSPCQTAPPLRLTLPWGPLQFLLSSSPQSQVWKLLSVVVRFLEVSTSLVNLPTSIQFLKASSGELSARGCFLLLLGTGAQYLCFSLPFQK